MKLCISLITEIESLEFLKMAQLEKIQGTWFTTSPLYIDTLYMKPFEKYSHEACSPEICSTEVFKRLQTSTKCLLLDIGLYADSSYFQELSSLPLPGMAVPNVNCASPGLQTQLEQPNNGTTASERNPNHHLAHLGYTSKSAISGNCFKLTPDYLGAFCHLNQSIPDILKLNSPHYVLSDELLRSFITYRLPICHSKSRWLFDTAFKHCFKAVFDHKSINMRSDATNMVNPKLPLPPSNCFLACCSFNYSKPPSDDEMASIFLSEIG